MFPPYGKDCFQCQFLFPTCKLCLRYTVRNFNENPSMRANILRARASELSSHFCEQFEQRPNFASTFKLDGTIRYPCSIWLSSWNFRNFRLNGSLFGNSTISGFSESFPGKFPYHLSPFQTFRNFWLNGRPGKPYSFGAAGRLSSAESAS